MQVTSARNLQSAPDDNGMDFSFFFSFFFHYYYYFIFCFLFFFFFSSAFERVIYPLLSGRLWSAVPELLVPRYIRHPLASFIRPLSPLSLSLSLSPNSTWCLYISRYPYERHRSLSLLSRYLAKTRLFYHSLHPPWNHQKWVNYLHFLSATRVPFFYHFIPHTAIYWLLRCNHWFQSLYGDRILRLR